MSRMRSRLALGLAAMLLMLGSVIALPTSSASAQDEVSAADYSAGNILIIIDGPLNVRDAATTSGTILDVLPEGELLEVLSGPVSADGYLWYQIEWDDSLVGYVAADFVAEYIPGFAPGTEVVVADGPLNVRDADGTGATIIGQLAQDATATIVSGPTAANGYQWYRITGPYDGYVAGEFLAEAPDGPIIVGGLFPLDSLIFINTDFLNVRDAAGLSSNVIDVESDGAIGTVIDGPTSADGYAWYLVAFGEGQNTYQGWVAGEFLSGGITVGENAIVADGPLNVRDSADISGTAIDVLQTDDVVNVVSGPYFDTYIWFEVQYDTTTGYVAGRYLGALIVG